MCVSDSVVELGKLKRVYRFQDYTLNIVILFSSFLSNSIVLSSQLLLGNVTPPTVPTWLTVYNFPTSRKDSEERVSPETQLKTRQFF